MLSNEKGSDAMTTTFAHRSDLLEHSPREEREIRVQDYLNDKLQDVSDLAGIDTLLEDVKRQQALLEQQVPALLLWAIQY